MSYAGAGRPACHRGPVEDRVRITALAAVTVPLAWFALQHDAGSGSATAAHAPAASSSPSTSAPAPSAAASTPSAGPAQVVPAGTGHVVLVPGRSPVSGTGRLHRYTVSVEDGLGIDPVDFAAQVQRTLADPRSWGHDGAMAFQRVDSGPADIHVVLASPTLTDRMCAPLKTQGKLSCGNGSTAVVNSFRWLRGADAYVGDLPEYRHYVVNHEVGHTLGHGHEQCGGPDRLAPVMMQQTKGVGACLPSPWPFP